MNFMSRYDRHEYLRAGWIFWYQTFCKWSFESLAPCQGLFPWLGLYLCWGLCSCLSQNKQPALYLEAGWIFLHLTFRKWFFMSLAPCWKICPYQQGLFSCWGLYPSWRLCPSSDLFKQLLKAVCKEAQPPVGGKASCDIFACVNYAPQTSYVLIN